MQKSKIQFKNQNFISPLLIIFLAVALRLIPHPPNVAPIAAMALFGGVYINKRYALIVPILVMILSDIFLGFHESMFSVYLSFIIIGLIGIRLAKHKKPMIIIGATLFSSLIFFILTNFNYWYAASLYPKTLEGLMQSYYFALPFFRNSIIGDLFYVGLLFGAYELGLRHQENLIPAKN